MGTPIISATVIDVNSTTKALTGDNTVLIKYHSTARAVMAVEENGGAIDENLYIIRNGDRTGYGTNCDFKNVESNVFKFSAEDEHGHIGTATVKADMIDYVPLTCHMGNSKPDGEGNMRLSCTGNYFNGSFGAKNNSLEIRYWYEGTDGKSVSGQLMTVSISGNTYYAYADISGLDYQATYSFEITASDELEEATSTENAVTSLPIFHWGENDFTFEVPVDFNGAARLPKAKKLFIGNGNDYIAEIFDNYLQIASYDILSLSASNVIKLSAPSIQINNKSVDFGTWTPLLGNSDAVVSYDTYEGWYQKLGSVVTIGWNIKATISSGYHSTALKIRGVPFYPSGNAFGGGVAFGIYTTSDFIFEGWGVNTDGEITARLQPCDKTTSGNLQIGSTCYYPQNGGTVTLAGTICYMI